MPGYQQRAARAKAKAPPGTSSAGGHSSSASGTGSSFGGAAPSSLGQYLLEQWSWGHISAPTVQKIALAATKDGLLHPDIKILAGLGKGGQYERNCNAELLKKLPDIGLTPETSTFRLPMALPGAGFKMVEQSLLLPHELFSLMFQHYPAAFQERVVGKPGALEEFWQEFAGNPMLEGHELLTRAGYKTKAVPLSLHGDGVPVAGVGKVSGLNRQPSKHIERHN